MGVIVMSIKDVAAVYVRVSTQKESQKESPEHQKAVCLEKANMEELDVHYIYEPEIFIVRT
jgi:site-specific DNA recombinase